MGLRGPQRTIGELREPVGELIRAQETFSEQWGAVGELMEAFPTY
jgi:hypothetical protein